MRNVTRALISLILLILSAAAINTCKAQAAYVGRFAVIEDTVKIKLARDWDKFYATTNGERGYCLKMEWVAFIGDRVVDTIPHILDVYPAVTDSSRIGSVHFKESCPGPWLHTHPPFTCHYDSNDEPTSCHRGGTDANQCAPSDVDLQFVPTEERPADAIQCDRNAIFFFAPLTIHKKREFWHPRFIIATAVVGAAVIGGKHDRDPGGYKDGISTKAAFPDKLVHLGASCALASWLVDVGIKPRWAAVSALGAGVAWELGQGYVSKYDIGADAVGSILGAAWGALWH
jgi:hypothetical protein